MPARHVHRLLLAIAIVSTIGCDRITKHVATTMLEGRPEQSFLADTIRIVYAENPGGFLSLGANLPPRSRTMVFTVVTFTALVALLVVAGSRRWNRTATLGVALFVAGGVSNLFDRLTHGSVVDFLNVGIGPLRTGIFNVADVAIMGGALLFLAAELRNGSPTPPAPDTSR
jgi:signal peptidase II